jgi:hypothetical protein
MNLGNPDNRIEIVVQTMTDAMTYPYDDAFKKWISSAALRYATGAGHTRRTLYPQGTLPTGYKRPQ